MHELARGMEVKTLVNCDAALYGMSWSSDGINLTLTLEDAKRGWLSLECTWAAAIHISLDSKPQVGGPPLTFETFYESLASGRFRVKFDFGDRGIVSIECNELVLRRIENSEPQR